MRFICHLLCRFGLCCADLVEVQHTCLRLLCSGVLGADGPGGWQVRSRLVRKSLVANCCCCLLD